MRPAAEIARENATVTYAAGVHPAVARSRNDCAWLDHPPATYNPAMNFTWCLCGAVRQPGNHGSSNGDWHLPPMAPPSAPWTYGLDPDPAAASPPGERSKPAPPCSSTGSTPQVRKQSD